MAKVCGLRGHEKPAASTGRVHQDEITEATWFIRHPPTPPKMLDSSSLAEALNTCVGAVGAKLVSDTESQDGSDESDTPALSEDFLNYIYIV